MSRKIEVKGYEKDNHRHNDTSISTSADKWLQTQRAGTD
jgi:hypothetical protein